MTALKHKPEQKPRVPPPPDNETREALVVISLFLLPVFLCLAFFTFGIPFISELKDPVVNTFFPVGMALIDTLPGIVLLRYVLLRGKSVWIFLGASICYFFAANALSAVAIVVACFIFQVCGTHFGLGWK